MGPPGQDASWPAPVRMPYGCSWPPPMASARRPGQRQDACWACPPTAPAPRTPDVNVASKGVPNPCKINTSFCAGPTRPSLLSTLTSGGRGGEPSSDRERPAPPPPGPLQGKKKGGFLLQRPVQDLCKHRGKKAPGGEPKKKTVFVISFLAAPRCAAPRRAAPRRAGANQL